MGDRFLSSASIGRNLSLSLSLSMRVPNPSPVLDKNPALMGPEILSSTGAGVWRKAPKAFPGSNSVLDKFQSASSAIFCHRQQNCYSSQAVLGQLILDNSFSFGRFCCVCLCYSYSTGLISKGSS